MPHALALQQMGRFEISSPRWSTEYCDNLHDIDGQNENNINNLSTKKFIYQVLNKYLFAEIKTCFNGVI